MTWGIYAEKSRKEVLGEKTPKAELKKWYELMTLGSLLDERAPNYLKQAVGWSYHAPYAGHDGIQLAIGQTFVRGEDHLFPYYRDMLTAVAAGVNAEEIILNGISKATDSPLVDATCLTTLLNQNGTSITYHLVLVTTLFTQLVLPVR